MTYEDFLLSKIDIAKDSGIMEAIDLQVQVPTLFDLIDSENMESEIVDEETVEVLK